jgi:hypothetical protein
MLAAAVMVPLTALGLAGVALAQADPTPAPTYDPAQLPVIKGKVAQYTLTPRGDVDGFLLEDGTQVHVWPYLSSQLVFAVRPGDQVTIHGLRARAIPMVAAMSVTNDASGITVTGNGPRVGWRDGVAMEVEGRIKATLHGPRGEPDGALLEDGTIVRLSPPEAERLAAQLAPRQSIYVRGSGLATPLGRVIAAREIGPNKTQLSEVRSPMPPMEHGFMEHAMAHWMHRMRGDVPAPPSPPPQ